MLAYIIYKKNSDHQREVEEYASNFERIHPQNQIKLVEADSQQGIVFVNLYQITRFPTVLVIRENGEYVNGWLDNDDLPLMDEVYGYLINQI